MRVLLIILILFTSSCVKRTKIELEYSKGDIVYLKPDSTRVLIIETDPYNCGCGNDKEYNVRSRDLDMSTWISKEEIYSEEL